jgi:regulatory protein
MKELSEAEALGKAAAACSTTEYCRLDMAEKLKRWGQQPPAIERILRRLEAERFMDEERYARAFVRDKYRFAKWGRVKIAGMLRQKAIPQAVIRRALDEEIDETEYRRLLREALLAKQKSIRADSDYERNGKLIRFAMGRGYEPEAIRSCLNVDDEDFFP